MTTSGITRYNASAGSGKTYILTQEYLNLLFDDNFNYRRILAVTFTNKAAAEMKERILVSLYHLASGMPSGYLEHLLSDPSRSEEKIRSKANRILEGILHDYSLFSVGTIDSFFQRILRSFARETGLHAGFNLILDHSLVLSDAYDALMASLEDDQQMLDWLISYSRYEIGEGNDWNLRKKVLGLGQEIFTEDFRILEREGKIVRDREVLSRSIGKLFSLTADFRRRVKEYSESALKTIDLYSLDESDFKGGSRGLVPWLRTLPTKLPPEIKGSPREAADNDTWTRQGHTPPGLAEALDGGLRNTVKELVEYYDANIAGFYTAEEVLANLYSMGIISDLSGKVRSILSEQNRFLLSDAGDVINRIIGDNPAPFIYEKTGTRYNYYMIDEFQDTSQIQWNNFRPLINNSIGEGYSNLVVGDIKQSIYRWRNSDWRIFRNLQKEFNPGSFHNLDLDRNWRSCRNIISFNNALFSVLPGYLEAPADSSVIDIGSIYSDVIQKDPGNLADGHIRLQVVRAEDDLHQTSLVLDRLPGLVEEIQDNGYEAHEIGILVRTNDQGKRVIERMMQYAATVGPEKQSKYSYQIISPDSLMLSLSPSIIFLVSLLKNITEGDDPVTMANMIYGYILSTSGEEMVERPSLAGLREGNDIKGALPEGYAEFLAGIREKPVYEIVEQSVDFFGLSSKKANIPYITTFLDLVLDIAGTEVNDIPTFLEWWENEGIRKSVASSDQAGSMQLMTIHKAKGLQFNVVIIPFISWPFRNEGSSILWVETGFEPFREMGAIPVRYRKNLENTFFAARYDEERTQTLLDNLNLLYVAFTRARECLYGFMPRGNRNIRDAGFYVSTALSEGKDTLLAPFAEAWNEETGLMEYGAVPLKSRPGKAEAGNLTQEIPYPPSGGRNRLVLKLHGEEYYRAFGQDHDQWTDWGILMHRILESVATADDVKPVVERMCECGEIPHQKKGEILEMLTRMIDSGKARDWFSDSALVKRETAILLGTGQVKRPDRVMIFDDRVEVVDFKFGAWNDKYITQVREYMSILVGMGYQNVNGFLWFAAENRIVEVEHYPG